MNQSYFIPKKQIIVFSFGRYWIPDYLCSRKKHTTMLSNNLQMNYIMEEGFVGQLDYALRLFCEGNINVNGKEWFSYEVEKKLVADGMIVIDSKSDDTALTVKVTERGRIFYANGGYIEREKEIAYRQEIRKKEEEERINRAVDRKDQKLNRWVTFAAVLVSAICAVINLMITCCSQNKVIPTP